jgi:di/tricarboxylate transporter
MTFQIALVLSVLGITIFLFVSELLRVDVIAIIVMISLAWLGLVKPEEAFSGLASNAVISIIAVMILGYGVDRSGAMNRITRPIITAAGSNERRLIGLVSMTVGLISAFMQNIGAAALFLPAMLRIAKRTDISVSRLLMPMGFAAILGGNLSMVGSSPLLILNDLLRQGGQEAFGLFSVTPAGITLLGAGVLYFLIFGKAVLPDAQSGDAKKISIQRKLIETWHLPTTIYTCLIPSRSPLVGKTREEAGIWTKYKLNLLALAEGNDVLYAPWRHTPFAPGQRLALLGDQTDLVRFVSDYELMFKKDMKPFEDLEKTEQVGFAEFIIPARSPIIGKTLIEIAIRKVYGVEPIMLFSGDREVRKDFSDHVLQAGTAIIVHGRWSQIKAMADNITFVLVTPIEATEAVGESRPLAAILCFVGAILLALSGVQLSLGLLTGAIVMILLRIVPIEEAYRAVDWRTVFLLAGLIPLGIAMDNTGAAQYVATQMMQFLEGSHTVFILFAVGLLSTLFSLFMSNAAATVLLVPLVMIMGNMSGINPRGLALLVALCASNSFVLPTHQVNALLMSPAGYRNADYMRAGGVMTIIFLTVSVSFIYLFYV